jgi:hypothetical protein
MAGPKVRQSHILKALRERYKGQLDAGIDGDGASLLLASMRLPDNTNNRRSLCEQLEKMHTGGTLVVSWRDEVAISVTLPELAISEDINESESVETVPAPKGNHRTVQPLTSDGKSIGTTLAGTQVGPVEVSYTSAAAAAAAKEASEEVAAAGEMLLEVLLAAPQETMTRQEIARFILETLNGVFTGLALQNLTQPVIGWLSANGHLQKVANKEDTYRLVKPKAEKKSKPDLNEAIRQLLRDLEDAQETEARLNREITELKQAAKQCVSPEKLNEILDDLEAARSAEKRLNEENRKLTLEQERMTKAHAAELAQLRDQIAAAKKTNRELQQQVEEQPAGIDEATKKRMRAMGYNVE